MSNKVLNLLVIDEEQLYAEHLIGLLSNYFDDINLGFWDEKAELVKGLRNSWDVLIFHRAYDMAFTDVVGIIQEMSLDLPIIQLIGADEAPMVNEAGLPELIEGDMIKTLQVGQDDKIVMAVCLQAAYVQSRRQLSNLRHILKESEQRANILIKNSKSAVAYIDQGMHIFANDPYLELFGYDSVDDIIGVPVVDLISGGDNVKGFKQFLRKFDKGDRSQVEFAFESKKTDGTTFASKLQLAAATLEGEPVTQMIIQRNDANAAEIAKKLAAAERQDPLTGLANRIGFNEKIEEVRNDTVTHGIPAALVYVTIDGIGKINSSTGLSGVDTTVKYIANLLSESFEDGFVARFSDSTFAIVVSDVNKDKVLAIAQAVCTKVENLLIEVGTRTVTTTLSVGIVMIDGNAPESQVLIDRALETVRQIHQDTDGVGNKIHVFDISEYASDSDDALAEYIQNALVQNQFTLKYQPIYDINTDSSDLFEVYITLPMADGSELTLDKFSQIAKKHNLLDKLDRWILINASKQLAMTRKTHPQARLLMGLSSASLADGQFSKIVAQLVRAVGDNGVHPLILQFHEQDLVDYLAVAKRQFMALKEIDCPIGIHNFGVTAKSAETLEHLSPTMVRLSRNYTKDLDRQDNLEAVKTLVAQASEHGVDSLMPYIEDAGTMSMAWSVGARYLQGNYLQAPAETLAYAAAEEE